SSLAFLDESTSSQIQTLGMFTDTGPGQASSGLFTGGEASRKGADLSGPLGVCLILPASWLKATQGQGCMTRCTSKTPLILLSDDTICSRWCRSTMSSVTSIDALLSPVRASI